MVTSAGPPSPMAQAIIDEIDRELRDTQRRLTSAILEGTWEYCATTESTVMSQVSEGTMIPRISTPVSTHSSSSSSSWYSVNDEEEARVESWLGIEVPDSVPHTPEQPHHVGKTSGHAYVAKYSALSPFPPASPITGRREYTPRRSALGLPRSSPSPSPSTKAHAGFQQQALESLTENPYGNQSSEFWRVAGLQQMPTSGQIRLPTVQEDFIGGKHTMPKAKSQSLLVVAAALYEFSDMASEIGSQPSSVERQGLSPRSRNIAVTPTRMHNARVCKKWARDLPTGPPSHPAPEPPRKTGPYLQGDESVFQDDDQPKGLGLSSMIPDDSIGQVSQQQPYEREPTFDELVQRYDDCHPSQGDELPRRLEQISQSSFAPAVLPPWRVQSAVSLTRSDESNLMSWETTSHPASRVSRFFLLTYLRFTTDYPFENHRLLTNL